MIRTGMMLGSLVVWSVTRCEECYEELRWTKAGESAKRRMKRVERYDIVKPIFFPLLTHETVIYIFLCDSANASYSTSIKIVRLSIHVIILFLGRRDTMMRKTCRENMRRIKVKE